MYVVKHKLRAVWRQRHTRHGVLTDGKHPDTSNGASFRCFFEQTNGGLFVPLNLSVDLKLNVIDVRNGSLTYLFHLEFLLKRKDDAANNFRKEIINKASDRMNKLVNHSVGGGTRSVLMAAIIVEKQN